MNGLAIRGSTSYAYYSVWSRIFTDIGFREQYFYIHRVSSTHKSLSTHWWLCEQENKATWRQEWDSNPRVSSKLTQKFSGLRRYDRFGILPYMELLDGFEPPTY